MIRVIAFLISICLVGEAAAQERFITLSSTTSTEDSGLFGHILPRFRAASGIDVLVVAVGTGQALAIGARGDADALLVHDRAGEDKFVADGYGIAGLNAYTLTDRATWANFKNRQDLEILSEGDPALFNPYGSILVNPAKWPRVKAAEAKAWHEWLTSKPGLDAITSYRIAGEQLFFAPRSAAGIDSAVGEAAPHIEAHRTHSH
jgi:ABC-type tungstate transport system permease subunit